MDENLSRGYVALGKRGNVCPLATPPVDNLGKTYMAMVLAGAGFLFPYNRYAYFVYLLYASPAASSAFLKGRGGYEFFTKFSDRYFIRQK